jgi:hypothetical protein
LAPWERLSGVSGFSGSTSGSGPGLAFRISPDIGGVATPLWQRRRNWKQRKKLDWVFWGQCFSSIFAIFGVFFKTKAVDHFCIN